MSDSVPPDQQSAKRRKLNEANLCFQKLPTDQFLSKIALFDGDKVSIYVGGTEFKLPQALLCYHSTFFAGAFSNGFKEAVEKKLTMSSDHPAYAFELVIQWIYTGTLVLPRSVTAVTQSSLLKKGTSFQSHPLQVEDERGGNDAVSENTKLKEENRMVDSEHLSKYTAFLRLADEIDLLGSFDNFFQAIRDILLADPQVLSSAHIRSAAELPRQHPLRTMVAKACVGRYIEATIEDKFVDLSDPFEEIFPFSKELDDIESFASDLFKEYRKVIAGRDSDGHDNVHVHDPFTGGLIHILMV